MTTKKKTASAYCKTCGSEIVETVNDSLFRDGECCGCEYQRYKSQSELLATLVELNDFLQRPVWEREAEESQALQKKVDNVIAKAYGNAA